MIAQKLGYNLIYILEQHEVLERRRFGRKLDEIKGIMANYIKASEPHNFTEYESLIDHLKVIQ